VASCVEDGVSCSCRRCSALVRQLTRTPFGAISVKTEVAVVRMRQLATLTFTSWTSLTSGTAIVAVTVVLSGMATREPLVYAYVGVTFESVMTRSTRSVVVRRGFTVGSVALDRDDVRPCTPVRFARWIGVAVVSVGLDAVPLGGGVVAVIGRSRSVGSLVLNVTSALFPVMFVICTFEMIGAWQSIAAICSTVTLGVAAGRDIEVTQGHRVAGHHRRYARLRGPAAAAVVRE